MVFRGKGDLRKPLPLGKNDKLEKITKNKNK